MKSLNKINKITIVFCMAALILSTSSCEDELTTDSSTAVAGGPLFGSTGGLKNILRSAYTTTLFGELTAGGQEVGTYVGIPGFNLYYDLSGQDIVVAQTGHAPENCYMFNTIRTSALQYGGRIWGMMYLIINQTNAILDALPTASGSATEKNAIEGQCKALRGICYFHLMLNYQQTYAIAKDKRGVILRTSGTQPMDLGFSTVQQCYDQIVKDLSEAKTALADFDRSGKKWQVNADVASGYLARVYQVMGNWNGALAEATAVYSKYNTLMTEAQWCGGQADITIPEIIWAVENTNLSNNRENSPFAYWHNQDPSYGEGASDGPISSFRALFVDQKYVDMFDATDYRGTKCTKTTGVTDADEKPVMFWHRTSADPIWQEKWAYNKFKYYGDDGQGTRGQRNYADYSILRSAEMLLIKAEAEASLNQEATALATLNTLQTARNATLTTTTVKADLLEAIYVERRKELLGEGVTGMYDNVRLQKDLLRYAGADGHFTWGLTNLDAVSTGVAKMPSNDYRYFCQIPDGEFGNNKALDRKDQNPPSGQ